MSKDIETIQKKKKKWEIKNAISEINNTLKGINGRLDEAEDWISDLEDEVKRKKYPGKAEKRKKNFKKWGELKKHFGQQEV